MTIDVRSVHFDLSDKSRAYLDTETGADRVREGHDS